MTSYSDDVEAFTGDAAGAAVLRRSLAELARLEAGTPLGDKAAAVLAGRLGMRELAEDADAVAFAARGMAAFDELWSGMDPAERAEALAAGAAYEQGLETEA